jgi:hypothetical protein
VPARQGCLTSASASATVGANRLSPCRHAVSGALGWPRWQPPRVAGCGHAGGRGRGHALRSSDLRLVGESGGPEVAAVASTESARAVVAAWLPAVRRSGARCAVRDFAPFHRVAAGRRVAAGDRWGRASTGSACAVVPCGCRRVAPARLSRGWLRHAVMRLAAPGGARACSLPSGGCWSACGGRRPLQPCVHRFRLCGRTVLPAGGRPRCSRRVAGCGDDAPTSRRR